MSHQWDNIPNTVLWSEGLYFTQITQTLVCAQMCKCDCICNFDPHLFMLQTFHGNYVVTKIILHTHVYTFEEFTIYTAVIFFYKMLIWASQSLVNLLMTDHCPLNTFEHLGMIFKYFDNLFAVNFQMSSHHIPSHSPSPPNLPTTLLSHFSVLLQTLLLLPECLLFLSIKIYLWVKT